MTTSAQTTTDTLTSRRKFLAGSGGIAASLSAMTMAATPQQTSASTSSDPSEGQHSTITTKDGTVIYYVDWGNRGGQPVVFSHGWPLSVDAFEDQIFFLANNGYRCIALDRRCFGRSSQPW